MLTLYAKMRLYCSIISCFISICAIAQTVPVGQTGLEESIRLLQLVNKLPISPSLTIRPNYFSDSLSQILLLQKIDSSYSSPKKTTKFQFSPISFNTKFNSHHPFGWNDAGMRMAKGFQQSISAGFFYKLGPLSVQLQPEYYYTANNNYETTSFYGSANNRPIAKFYWGQSSIRLNLGAVSLGLSSENLWWGPGQFSSLLMSNNAPGFKHISFNTREPIKTWLGNLEWQIIVGQLNEDSTAPYENNYLKPQRARNETRYYNGFVVTLQPKILKNIFIGFNRFEQLYNSTQRNRQGNFIKKYLPVFTFETADANASRITPNDGGVGIFARWLIPSKQTEFYVDYSYNDFKQNLRDFTLSTNHASAFLAGFKKIFTLKDHSYIDLSGEVVNMSQNSSYIIRDAANWYEHGQIRQGYTNQNQILGAGSGFGNNVQTIAIKKVNGFNHWGFKFQRIQQDPKGIIYANISNSGMRANIWTDFDLGFLFQKRVNQLLIKAETHWVHSKNYGWSTADKINLFLQLNCLYFLH